MNKPLYKRELSHSYLVICGIPQEERNRYTYQMILKNRIPGLLPCSERYPEGEACLYYDISSRQSFGRLCESAKISYAQIRGLVDNLAQVQDTMAEYLLEESALVLDPAYMYMDLETEQMFFLYYPFTEEREPGERLYLPVAEFLLEHVDHREERAVKAAYQFYKLSKAESFTIESFRTLLERDVPEVREADCYAVADAEGACFREAPAVYEYRMPQERLLSSQISLEGSGGEADLSVPGEQVYGENGKEGKRTGRPGRRMGWILGLMITVPVFAGLCAAIWYLQPTGQEKACLFAGLSADGIALLLFLWKTIAEDNRNGEPEGEELTGEAAAGRAAGEAATGKAAGEAITGAFREEFHESSCAENMLCGPTVFFGEGGGKRGWEEETDQRPRPRLAETWEGGREYSLDRLPVMVGKMRSKVQILLSDASVSRIHARFVQKDGRTALIDLNSTNGTSVNGIRLEQEETVILENGDEILFGNMAMRYLE